MQITAVTLAALQFVGGAVAGLQRWEDTALMTRKFTDLRGGKLYPNVPDCYAKLQKRIHDPRFSRKTYRVEYSCKNILEDEYVTVQLYYMKMSILTKDLVYTANGKIQRQTIKEWEGSNMIPDGIELKLRKIDVANANAQHLEEMKG